jgi:hypothetical protein
MREYIVTLHKREDLESFYDDMETPGGNLYIPNRTVPVKHRRSISRSTHYMLTDQEADQIKHDPRVLTVELTLEEMGIEVTPFWIESSENGWDKSYNLSSQMRNWGLLRCSEGVSRPNWGFNGTEAVAGEVHATSSGKHVDVVIVDGIINPAHPEFAKNPDGTGGTRVNQYNWFSHNQEIGRGPNSNYIYGPYNGKYGSYHGHHVAGTAAGNSQGWARDANIYNINPYGRDDPNNTQFFIDYIRAWHASKPINPETGRRNPTITNHSYGSSIEIDRNSIEYIQYRGNRYYSPFTTEQLELFGFRGDRPKIYFSIQTSLAEDYKDAIADGIIVVGAAGNDTVRISTIGSEDYDNFVMTNNGVSWYYARGASTAAENAICVGSAGEYVGDYKSSFSNSGPRIDIYAPGSTIMSSFDSSGRAPDYRNSTYRIDKIGGTSMASPQVAGVLACLAEQWPSMTQADAIEYLKKYGTMDQMASSSQIGTGRDLKGSDNRYLKYVSQRPQTGELFPKLNQGLPPSTGIMWPRQKIYRYGR